MRGVEQGSGNNSPEPRKIFEGLHIPPGVAITGLAGITATIAGVAIYERRRRKKSASESPNPPETKKK